MICSICGKEYDGCYSCKENRGINSYKLHTDTIEHFKIYQIIRGYSTGVYTGKETREKLLKTDLSDLETLRPNIKELINKIQRSDDSVEGSDVDKKTDSVEGRAAVPSGDNKNYIKSKSKQ